MITTDPHIQPNRCRRRHDRDPPRQHADNQKHTLHGGNCGRDLDSTAAQPTGELALTMLNDETGHTHTVDARKHPATPSGELRPGA